MRILADLSPASSPSKKASVFVVTEDAAVQETFKNGAMGFFYWSLGILNVARMVTQGLGYSGRAVFSGVTEMIARTVVSLGFVGAFGFTAICFADQTAWITATCYIFPTCLWCIRKSTKMLTSIAVRVNNAS